MKEVHHFEGKLFYVHIIQIWFKFLKIWYKFKAHESSVSDENKTINSNNAKSNELLAERQNCIENQGSVALKPGNE